MRMGVKKPDTNSTKSESIICERCRTTLKPGSVRCESCGHRQVVEIDTESAENYLDMAKSVLQSFED